MENGFYSYIKMIMKKFILYLFILFFVFCNKKRDENVCSKFYNKESCIKNLYGFDIEIRGVGFIISSDKYQYFYKKDKSIQVYRIEAENLVKDSSITVDADKINYLVNCFKSLNIQKLNGNVGNHNVIEMKVDDDTFVYYVKTFNSVSLKQKNWVVTTQKCTENICCKTFNTK